MACGRHPEDRNSDWVVFYLSGPPGAANVAKGTGSVSVSFAPAQDVTSGRLYNTSCSYVTEVVLATNANGTVVWNILHTGSPSVEAVDGGATYVVKLF